MRLTQMLYDQNRSEKYKMAASKPEIPTSNLLDKIGTKVPRQYTRFRGPATQCDYQNIVRPNR